MPRSRGLQSRHPKPILIVGAGLAGLSAAIELTKAGVPILVVEAQSRCGGRVRTVQLPDSKQSVDCGATFFHGTKGNAAWDLALRYKLINPTSESDSSGDEDNDDNDDDGTTALFSMDSAYISSDGTVSIIPHQRVLPIVKLHNDGVRKIERNVFDDGVSFRSVVNKTIAEANHDDDKSFIDSVAHGSECFERAVNGCNSTDELSANLSKQYFTLPGDNVRATNPPGMSGLVNAMVSELSQLGVDVLLNTEVVSIKGWLCNSIDDHVTVKIKKQQKIEDAVEHSLSHVDEKEDEISVSGVIWTPSVGVTMEAVQNQNMFVPELPERFTSALSRRGFQTVEQVHACVSSPKCADSRSDNVMIPILWEKPNDSHWQYGLFGILRRGSAVTLWLSGKHAEQFRLAPKEQRRSDLTELVRKTVPGYESAEVTHVTYTNWSCNKMIKGSYSFPLTGGKSDDVEELAKGLGESLSVRLWMAGEATHEKFYSTMHGAIETGRREAERSITTWRMMHR